MSTPAVIKNLLCEQWCADAVVSEDQGGLRLSLPLYESDGDSVTVWMRPELGGWRISDSGTTLMRMSYDMDVDLLAMGNRARVFESILKETGIDNHDGDLQMFVKEGDLGSALLGFGQAVGRIGDIKLWSKSRVASTFYDDLAAELNRIAGAGNVQRDYIIPTMADAEDYPIDFYLRGGRSPLYVFGVPSGDKARLATITLQRFSAVGHQFESLIVPSDLGAIPHKDLRRLMNAANEMVDSLTAKEPLERKVRHRIAA